MNKFTFVLKGIIACFIMSLTLIFTLVSVRLWYKLGGDVRAANAQERIAAALERGCPK